MDVMKDIKEEFEDGELPEDGEICDDEDDGEKRNDKNSQQTLPAVKQEEPAPAPVQTHHHHHHHQAPGSNGSVRESRERDEKPPRRFEHSSPPKRDPDPFGPHNNEPQGNDLFGSGDKDYRVTNAGGPASEEEPFTDTDYRQSRRRRHSPIADDTDYDSRSKRPFFGGRVGSYRGGGHGGPGAGFRGGQKPRFQTDHQICKFFREGYCRDGDNCLYSHQAEDSLRRSVLCNFYANSFCKKGLQCLMLHGEFPCIEFHKGICKNNQCRFSHVPLTDYTRPIVDKALADEEARQQQQAPSYRQNPVANAAAAAAAANVMAPRRRVLLPGGPNLPQTSPPHAPIIHAPVPQTSHLNGGQLPPPQVVVPTIQPRSLPPMYPPVGSGGYFNQAPRPEQVQGLPPPRTIEPPRPSTHLPQPVRQMLPHVPPQLQSQGLPPPQQVIPERRAQSPPAFNLEAMLNKLANSDKRELSDEDSPASPPQNTFSSNPFGVGKVAVIPQEATVTYKILRVTRRLPYSNIENVEKIPANDPRKAKASQKQFDAFSSMLSAAGNVVSDPRLRAQKERATEPVKRQENPMFSSWMPQIS
uniref:C3H1-type domain-containing protein n=1 Tax=Caenorhabditis japonica TaxID=281687 RepID=A0A8R1DJR2_CAEJA